MFAIYLQCNGAFKSLVSLDKKPWWKNQLIFHGNAHVLSISQKNKIAISVFMASYKWHNGEVVCFYHIYLFKRRNW